jgi:LiaI-LiaF-like transmembrane region
MGRIVRCSCPRCTIRGLMGPAIIVTVGLLFLLDQMSHNSRLDFENTWPFILIVIGLVSLASALAPMTGHIEYPPPAPAPPYVPPVPPGTPPVAPPPQNNPYQQGG